MAFDHSSHRPSPQWSDMAAAAAGDKARVKKVKLLCSFGGRILPRPSDGTLRYVGGHTRIISVQKDATFPEFSAKMAETLDGPAVVFKYQLPGEDLDALISVSCAEDLANMLEEHDKLIEAAPDGSAKIRAFLFSPAELAAETDQSMRIGSVTDDADRVYFEVINGMASASGIGAIRRRDSNASFASSTQNSEGTTGGDAVDGGASEGMSSGLLSYSGDHPQDATGLVHVDGDNAPTIMAADIGPPDKSTSSQNLNFRSREQTPLMSFAPSTYIEPVQFQYTNPQQLGVAGGPRTVNLVPFPMHHYMTGAPVNTLSSASEIDSSNQIQESLEFKLDMSHGGSNLQHLRIGNFMPLSQLPPLPPFYAQSPNIEGYGLNQMPSIPQSQTSSSNDCLMCQKALPHAHSDTLIQDHALGSVGHLHEVNPVFYSYRSRDSVKQPVPYLTTGKMTQNFLEQKTESSILADQLADYLLPQNNDVKENANIRSDVQKTANANHVDVVLQNANELSWENKALDGTSAPKLMQCHMDPFQLQQQQDHHQLTHIFQQQGNPVKQELLANPSGIMEWQTLQTSQIQQEAVIHPAGANAATNSHFAAAEAISQEHVNMPYYEYVRTVSDRVNMLDLDRMEASEFGKTGVNTECISSSHYTNPAEISTANLDRSQLHNLEPFRANEAATIVAFSKLSLHNTRMGIEHPVPSSSYPEGYCGIVNGNINDGAYGASQSQSREMLGHSAALPSCDVSFQLSDVIGPTGAVETCHEPMTSNIHVGNQDIPSVPGGISSLPSRPNTMTDEYVAPKDSCIPNYVGVSDGSNIIAMLEEGSLQSLSERHINDFSYEPMQLIKEVSEDHNVQQLQGVDENVAVSIHQSNVTGSAFETEEFIYHFNNVKAIENNNDTEKKVTDEKDIKSKNLEMAQHGIQLADNVGNLQIIKNNDLEELRELGSGAFGTVYHGKWRGTDVAIKRINDRCFVGKKSEKERMRTDFWNEACKLADLHHPNVVAFYGIVLDGHQGCISTVTEYMINGSLRQVIQRNDRIFDRNKRLIIAMDVAFGMEYLHAKNIIHFDLKSDNVLVNFRDPQRPICKVGDLGLSKVKCKTLISGGMRGTLPWMAPELLCGNDSLVSEKVDIYSFGVVMWELLTSKEPYSDLHYGSIIGGILSNTLRPPIPESCELDWRMLMEQCWSSEPSERPSFTEITDRLRLMAAAPHLKAQGQAQK